MTKDECYELGKVVKTQREGGINGFFRRLFGGSQNKEEVKPQSQPTQPAAPTPEAAQEPVVEKSRRERRQERREQRRLEREEKKRLEEQGQPPS